MSNHPTEAYIRERRGGLRSEVLWFALAMERELQENDHKGGWHGCTPAWLLNRLRQETVELERAITEGNPVAIQREAADVANFAMMIADNADA